MSIEWLAELAWKSLLLSILALALLNLARSRSAAEKSLLGDAGLLSLLLLPISLMWLPDIEVAPPPALTAAVETLAPRPATGGGAQVAGPAAMEQAATIDWNALGLLLYLLPAAVLTGALLYSLLRLRELYRRASVLEDGRWLTALAAAQNRVGVKHGTALLVSDDVNSPISWGIVRPVIVVDRAALAESDRAEPIIAHELAHVHRLDWLKLIVARLVIAIFWFNPLVWMLARRCHQLREEAADDAVLRTRVARADYATLLVTAVRHANERPLLAANGVAPSKTSISQRVRHVLDASKPRRPARQRWTVATIGIALIANGALAASEPVLKRSWDMDSQAGERAAAELAAIPYVQTRALARAIRSADWSARRSEADTNFYDARAIRPLMLALHDDDPTVRRIALWGLSEMRPTPDPIATPAVSRLLSDPVAEVRAEAAGAIGDFESVENSRSLEKLLLGDPSPKVRVRAAHSLGDIQDPNSRATLELATRDPDSAVRAKAQWALSQVLEAEKLMNR